MARDDDRLATLREVAETLAPLRRRAGSEGERQAAAWLADRLARAGARDARVEEVPFRDGYARMLLPLNLAALAAGIATRRRGRSLGAATIALAAAALIADDAANGRRWWRRLVTRPKRTTNVLAEVGPADAPHTLVVLAHHDAAPTGVIFDQRPQQWLARRFPALIDASDTSFPLWWPVLAAPLLVAVGAAAGLRPVLRAGVAACAGTTGLALDIGRDRIVPGANDNLSACAALVAIAERAGDDLPVRILLASCGAEEVLQGGIYAFRDRQLRELDPNRTWVLNLDTIGSPELVLLEGEGVLRMEDYHDPSFRDRIAAAAERATGPLRRGLRSRSSTDAVVPSRAGFPTATLCSFEPSTKCLTNYHQMTDTPDRLTYATIDRAVAVTLALAEDLA